MVRSGTNTGMNTGGMERNRVWMVGSALAAVVAMLAGWFLGIEPQLASASAADTSRAAVEVTNATHAAVLAQLVEDSRDRKQLTADFETLSASVPDGTAIPDFVNQLDALGETSGVTVTGLTVADAQPYTPAAATPAAPEATPSALITPQSLAALEVKIAVNGDYGRVLQFVDGLQSGARLFLVTGITTQVDTEQLGLVGASITGLVYVLVPPGSIVAPVADPGITAEAEAAVEVG